MTDLTSRVLNAIPSAAFEMTALLSLLRIDETTQVKTASISCERRPVLRINPEFVRRHCRTEEHLFLLVMHELHHVLLGHTRLFPRATRAHNIAFDAVINSMLVLRFPAETHRSFFLDLYGDEQGPLRLLAHPGGECVRDPGLAKLHAMLYEDAGVTSEEIFDALVRHLRSNPGSPGGGVLLGSHEAPGDENWGTAGPLDRDLVAAIRGIVEKWPPPESPITGRSLGGVLRRMTVAVGSPRKTVLSVMRQALLGAARKNRIGPAQGTRSIRVQDVRPVASDRHATLVRTAGYAPLLYWRPSLERHIRGGRTQVYLDVSGSMDPYLPSLYGALAVLRRHVEPEVRLFSTIVKTIGLADLPGGARPTDGGTDIRCVLHDMLDRRVRKALIVTDGYVGALSPSDEATLARAGCEIRVVLTPRGWQHDLENVAVRIDELPEDP